MAHILVVDDEKKMCDILVDGLREEGHDAVGAYGGREALERAGSARFDIVLTDLRMPDIDGLAVLRGVKETAPDTEVVMITAHATANTAVEAMKEGAFDYLIKPFSLDDVSEVVGNILRRKAAAGAAPQTHPEDAGITHMDDIVGRSPEMIRVFKQAGQVARKDMTVLVRGESGTGKELVARAIHYASPRADKPFVVVNCTALPETLFENELFGHEKGAFTGATGGRTGKFEAADGGTLFLDEIGDLSSDTQGKLLRALEQKSFHRVGGTHQVDVDVRIIAATNADLENRVKAHRFRQDLYYRLHVFVINLPPLRARGDDVAMLVSHFLRKGSASSLEMSPETMGILLSYGWPGNVRELENAVTSAALRCSGSTIRPEDLPAELTSARAGDAPEMTPGEVSLRLDDMERRMIEQALERAGGNKTNAARLLGITRRALYSRLQRLFREPDGKDE